MQAKKIHASPPLQFTPCPSGLVWIWWWTPHTHKKRRHEVHTNSIAIASDLVWILKGNLVQKRKMSLQKMQPPKWGISLHPPSNPWSIPGHIPSHEVSTLQGESPCKASCPYPQIDDNKCLLPTAVVQCLWQSLGAIFLFYFLRGDLPFKPEGLGMSYGGSPTLFFFLTIPGPFAYMASDSHPFVRKWRQLQYWLSRNQQ